MLTMLTRRLATGCKRADRTKNKTRDGSKVGTHHSTGIIRLLLVVLWLSGISGHSRKQVYNLFPSFIERTKMAPLSPPAQRRFQIRRMFTGESARGRGLDWQTRRVPATWLADAARWLTLTPPRCGWRARADMLRMIVSVFIIAGKMAALHQKFTPATWLLAEPVVGGGTFSPTSFEPSRVNSFMNICLVLHSLNDLIIHIQWSSGENVHTTERIRSELLYVCIHLIKKHHRDHFSPA